MAAVVAVAVNSGGEEEDKVGGESTPLTAGYTWVGLGGDGLAGVAQL